MIYLRRPVASNQTYFWCFLNCISRWTNDPRTFRIPYFFSPCRKIEKFSHLLETPGWSLRGYGRHKVQFFQFLILLMLNSVSFQPLTWNMNNKKLFFSWNEAFLKSYLIQGTWLGEPPKILSLVRELKEGASKISGLALPNTALLLLPHTAWFWGWEAVRGWPASQFEAACVHTDVT